RSDPRPSSAGPRRRLPSVLARNLFRQRSGRQALRGSSRPSHTRQEETPLPGVARDLPDMPCRGMPFARSLPAAARASPAARLVGSVRASSRSLFAELAIQPGFRPAPLSIDRPGRETEKLRALLDTQTAEVSQLDDLTLARMYGGEAAQRLIDGNDFRALLLRGLLCLA